MAQRVNTVFMPAAKRDLDKNGRVKDRLIDVCRFGARKDHVRVVVTRPRPSRVPNAPDDQIPILEVSPDGDVREVPSKTMTRPMADLFPADWRHAVEERRRERTAKKAARRQRFSKSGVTR